MVEIPTQVKDNQISDIIKSEILESDYINHKTTCHGNTSSLLQNQVTASDILFADYEGTIKQEIKQENEIKDDLNPSDFMSTEFCENIIENGVNSFKVDLEADSNDFKNKDTLEIKQEIEEIEDIQKYTIFEEKWSDFVAESHFIVNIKGR